MIKFNSKDEQEYEKHISKKCLNWLFHESFLYTVVSLVCLSFHIILSFASPTTYIESNILYAQSLFWIISYLGIQQLNKILKKTPEKSATHLGICGIFLIIQQIYSYYCLGRLSGKEEAVFLIIDIEIYSNITSNVFKKYIYQLPFYILLLCIVIYKVQITLELSQFSYILIFGSLTLALIQGFYKDQKERRNFRTRLELISERKEIKDYFLMMAQYNPKTAQWVITAKTLELLNALHCNTFSYFATNLRLKNDQKKDLVSIMREKIQYYKLMGRKTGGDMSSIPPTSEDFVYEDRRRCSLDNWMEAGRPKGKEFEIHFYMKGISEEITVLIERKGSKEQLKEEQMANTCKNIMFRAMSHNLKTPLNGILSFLEEKCRERPTLEERVMYMNAIFLQHKIDDILEFMKIEAGEQESQLEHFHVLNLLNKIKDICHISAQLDKLKIITSVIGDVPKVIFAERRKLYHILLHLVQNAIKYSKKFTTVTLYATKIPNTKLIEFGVEDQGQGIPPHKISKIFNFLSPNLIPKNPDKFFQISSTLEEDITTTSFGLPITQTIAKSIGSRIHVKSEYKKGSIFFFQVDLNRRVQAGTSPRTGILGLNQLCPVSPNSPNSFYPFQNTLISMAQSTINQNKEENKWEKQSETHKNYSFSAGDLEEFVSSPRMLISNVIPICENNREPEKINLFLPTKLEMLKKKEIQNSATTVFSEFHINSSSKVEELLSSRSLPSVNCINLPPREQEFSYIFEEEEGEGESSKHMNANSSWEMIPPIDLFRAESQMESKIDWMDLEESEGIVLREEYVERGINSLEQYSSLEVTTGSRNVLSQNAFNGGSASFSHITEDNLPSRKFPTQRLMTVPELGTFPMIPITSSPDPFSSHSTEPNTIHQYIVQLEESKLNTPNNYRNDRIKKRLLSVDDNGVNRLVLKRVMEGKDWEVVEAFNGAEALSILKEKIKAGEMNPFKVIFMDLNMPILNGFQATEKIIRMINKGKLKPVPVIALTAHDSQQIKHKCQIMGFSEFLSKPLHLDLLQNILSKYNLI